MTAGFSLSGQTHRLRILLDILIIVASICIILLGFHLVSVRAEKIRLQNRLARSSQNRSNIIVEQALNRYQLPATMDMLDILNAKLTEIGVLHTVMDITPEPPITTQSVTGLPVRVRLAPVTGNHLASLLNAIEHRAPRFMIVSLQMTRIRSGESTVDITMNLIMFQQTSQPPDQTN